MAHHTLRIQWFEDTWLTKQYKYNGLNVRGSPNVTYTIVWGHVAHHTIQIQWFDAPWPTKRYIYNGLVGLLTKPYKYIGLMAHGSPNNTYIMVWENMVHQTLQYNCLMVRGSPNHTYTMVWVHIALQTLQIH